MVVIGMLLGGVLTYVVIARWVDSKKRAQDTMDIRFLPDETNYGCTMESDRYVDLQDLNNSFTIFRNDSECDE